MRKYLWARSQMCPKAPNGSDIPICSSGCARTLWYMVRFRGKMARLGSPNFPSGMTHDDPINDPDLTERRHSMIIIAGRKLAAAGMVQFDEAKSTFTITDIGRIAAKYYIRHASIEVFQKEFRPKMTEADVLALLAMSTEVGIFFFFGS